MGVYIYLAFVCGIVVVTTPGAAGQSISLTSSINFSDDPVLCPDTLVQFECIGIDIEALQWRSNQTSLLIYTLSGSQIDTDPQPGRPPGFNFTLESFEINANQLSANLTAILSLQLSDLDSGTQIECLRGNSLIQDITVTYNTAITPPAPLFATNFTRGMDSSLNLSFYWNESFTRAHAVEMYCVNSSVGVDECNRCVPPNTTFVCPQIMQGEATSFSVGATNCGSQQGENVTFTVNPQAPGRTNVCSSVPIYSSEPAGELIGIKNTWSSAPNLSVYDPNILNYILSINATNDESVLQEKEVCLPATNQCEYVTSLSETREDQLQTIAVSVTAENVVGRGEPQPCSPTISPTNQIFVTTVVRNGSGTFVQCQFTTPSSQLTEECVFCYGNITQSCDQQSLTCRSVMIQDDRTGMASYDLPKEFCYQITAIVDGNTRAVVSGRVESECTLADLGGGGSTVVSPPSDERCLDINAVGSVLIENGVICYNGTSTGSLATYHCNSGFQLKNGDDVQRCQNDSNWNGQMATCRQEPCLNAARFFFAVAVVVSIVTIFGGLFGICKSRTISEKMFYTAAVFLVIALLCLLLVIIFFVSMETLQQNQPLCVLSNLVSILSAIACVICLTVLIGITFKATNRKGIFKLKTTSKESDSEQDKLPKLTGAELGKSFRDSNASGKHPSIATNNHSLVVEVFMYNGWVKKKQLKYRIGQIGGSKINWRGNGPYDYGTGQRPRIAINSNNMVVAVHENPSRDRCVYCVGLVGQETIEWGKETEFVEGCCPDVAITESKAILTFTTSGHKYYFVGNINSETKSIGLREDAKSFPNSNAAQLSIVVNNGGRVVAAYFTGGSICCMAGALKEDGEIKWHSEGPQNLVRSTADAPPVVSINSQGYVVVVLSLSNELYCFVGRTFDNSSRVGLAMEGPVKKYDNGYYPAASIDDENNIVEIHEAIWTTRLFYHVGKLLLETPV